MSAKKIWPFFLISLSCTLINSPMLTSLRLFFFAPFFAIAYSILSKKKALIIATMVGVMIDTLSADCPFGFYTLSYVLITLLLYRWRIYFVDNLIGLCSFTFVFSLLLTAIQRFFLPCFNISLPLTPRGLITDFLLLPLVDSCYALFCFYLPAIFYERLKKIWFRFLFFVKTSKHKNSKRKEAKHFFNRQ